MKAKIFIGAVAAFVLALGVYGWLQSRERAARHVREIAEEAAAAERKQKAEDDRKQAAQATRTERDDEVRLNEPERQRLQRRYPEAWDSLALRAGGNLDNCVVTASDEQRGETTDAARTPTLSARCGENLDKFF